LTKKAASLQHLDVQSDSPCGANVHLNTCFLRPPESILETASRSVRPFLHSSRQNVPILYNGPPPPWKLPLRMVDLDRGPI